MKTNQTKKPKTITLNGEVWEIASQFIRDGQLVTRSYKAGLDYPYLLVINHVTPTGRTGKVLRAKIAKTMQEIL